MSVRVLFFTLAFFFISLPVFAEGPPPGDQSGAQAQRFQEQSERERRRVEGKKLKSPEMEIQQEEKEPVPEGPSFVLEGVKITGAEALRPEKFHPAYEAYIKKKVTFNDLEIIAAKIEAVYKQKGYLTANAYIPKQTISDGIIEIRVAEGKMGELKVEGNKWFSPSYIKRFFHSQKGKILNFKKFQRDILRLNQNSDLEVKTLISPSKEPQASDIVLSVKDKFPWHVGAGVDNQGTRLTGRYRTSLYVRSTNVTGRGDTLFVNTILSTGAIGEFASYSIPLDSYGTKLAFDFINFWTKLGKEFSSFDMTGSTQIYTPRISREIILRENFTVYADLGLDIKSIKRLTDGSITANDQLRLPYLKFDLMNIDSLGGGGQNNFSPKFVFGTAGFLGASTRDNAKAGRPGTDGAFFKYEQSLGRTQRMPFDSYLSLRSQFQAASRDLPSSEQLQLGGANSVRGYPEGDYLADIGANLNLDWIFPMYLIPKDWKLPRGGTPLRNWIEPCVFMDLGGGKLINTLPGERKDKFLMGTGGGVRFHLYGKAFLKVEWAKALGDQPVSGAGSSTFSLTFQSEV